MSAATERICSHGERVRFCWDDATVAEREAFDFLHRSAFNYAVTYGLSRDNAEQFAAWSAGRDFDQPQEDWYSHPIELRQFFRDFPDTQGNLPTP